MPNIVIVDAYNAARIYPDLIREKFGDTSYTRCIHVQSKPVLTHLAKFESEKYCETLVYDGDLDKLLFALKKYDITAVIAGLDIGVELSDAISHALKLPNTNGIKKSGAKRNKFEMRQVVAAAGLAVPKFIKAKDLADILAWVTQNKLEYPIVLKALKSAGTDGIFICRTEDEIRAAHKKVIGSKSIMDDINTEVLAETFLSGTEYVVNTVSHNNQHYVTDIWQYQKRFIPGAGWVYDKEFLVSPDSATATTLIAYNSKVLDALEISYGPAHSEIILTKDGPVLVEVGARMTGAMNIKLHSKCLGHTQAHLIVDCYTDPEGFLKKAQKLPAPLKMHGLHTNAILEEEGTIQSISSRTLESIQALPSMVDVVVRLKEGQAIAPTRTLMQVPFRCFMAHESQAQLDKDYAEVEKLKQKLFVITPKQNKTTEKDEEKSVVKKQPATTLVNQHRLLKYGSMALVTAGFFYNCYRIISDSNSNSLSSSPSTSPPPPSSPKI